MQGLQGTHKNSLDPFNSKLMTVNLSGEFNLLCAGTGGANFWYLDHLMLFQPGEGRLCPPITKLKLFHIPVSLNLQMTATGGMDIWIGSSRLFFLQEKTLECSDSYVFEVFWKILGQK